MAEWTPENTLLGDESARPSDRLDAIRLPGPMHIEFRTDELTAICPVTEQRDFYDATVSFDAERFSVESKSLKLYLATFVDRGAFAEVLAHEIAGRVARCVEVAVTVTLVQNVRGGIVETVVATVGGQGTKSPAIGEQPG